MQSRSQIKLYCLAAVLGGAALLLVIIPIVLVLNWIREPFGSAEIVESTRALSVAEARELSGLPLPDSARNIRYAHFRQWIAYETFARFEAPVADCVAFAEKVIANPRANGNEIGTKTGRLVKLDKTFDQSVESSRHLKTDWFDVHSIKVGMEGGLGPSHDAKVWIDTVHGVCYYKTND